MPTRKLTDTSWQGWDSNKPCQDSDHSPATMIVLPPGKYEHVCPGCNHKTLFLVPPPPHC